MGKPSRARRRRCRRSRAATAAMVAASPRLIQVWDGSVIPGCFSSDAASSAASGAVVDGAALEEVEPVDAPVAGEVVGGATSGAALGPPGAGSVVAEPSGVGLPGTGSAG